MIAGVGSSPLLCIVIAVSARRGAESGIFAVVVLLVRKLFFLHDGKPKRPGYNWRPTRNHDLGVHLLRSFCTRLRNPSTEGNLYRILQSGWRVGVVLFSFVRVCENHSFSLGWINSCFWQ